MTNTIIDGVCKRLSDEFGEGYRVYTENVEQGFTEPCFFVSATSVQMTPILCRGTTGRYDRRQGINVTFYPKQDGDLRNEVYGVTERLIDVLEYIDADGPARGTEIIGEFIGDSPEIIGSVNIIYEFTVYKQNAEDTVKMGELKQEVDVNG